MCMCIDRHISVEMLLKIIPALKKNTSTVQSSFKEELIYVEERHMTQKRRKKCRDLYLQ